MKIRKTAKHSATTIITFTLKCDAPATVPDFNADAEEIAVRYEGETTFIFCGLGTLDECTLATCRNSAAKAVQTAQKLKRTKLAVVMPEVTSFDKKDLEKVILEGILLGSYKFTKYKSEKPVSIDTVEMVGSTLSPTEFNRCITAAEAVNYARDLVNDNASEITPDFLASEALKLAASKGIKVTVLDMKMLQKHKLNLIAAVGQASPFPPSLILLEYTGASRTSAKTAIIGKGVTFDSGGQNLKPTGSIETMREDMAGAAAVLGVFSTLAKTQPKVNCIGVIPAVHNAIGSNAYFPGDVYTSYTGKTVEIWSTDAEGRLILADAVAYCIDQFHPDRIIDLATLTGGVLSALGEIVAGLFSNSDQLAQALFDAGEKTDERLWRFPMYKEYGDSLKGEIGDLRNISKFKKGYASSIIGAAFIKEFVGETEWAHLDIAGTAFNEGSARGVIPQNATGFGVRLLLEYLGV